MRFIFKIFFISQLKMWPKKNPKHETAHLTKTKLLPSVILFVLKCVPFLCPFLSVMFKWSGLNNIKTKQSQLWQRFHFVSLVCLQLKQKILNTSRYFIEEHNIQIKEPYFWRRLKVSIFPLYNWSPNARIIQTKKSASKPQLWERMFLFLSLKPKPKLLTNPHEEINF